MFIPSVMRFALRLGGSAASHALACLLPSASAQDDSATARETNTSVSLPSGRTKTLSGEWTIEPTGTGSRVTLTMRYRRLLDPAWYFKPIERYGVKKAGEYFLAQTYKTP